MSTVESIARPRRNGERRRAPTASISKESPAITGVVEIDRKSGSAGMPRPISYAVFCLKKKTFSSAIKSLGQKELKEPESDEFILELEVELIDSTTAYKVTA